MTLWVGLRLLEFDVFLRYFLLVWKFSGFFSFSLELEFYLLARKSLILLVFMLFIVFVISYF